MSEHVCEHCFRVHTPCCPQCGCRSGEEETAPDNPWRDQLIKAESENHCGDLACQTRRTAAAVAVLTGWNEHQDLCWAVETFQVEIGVRDPALLGSEPSSIPSRGAIEAEAFERGQRSVREAYLMTDLFDPSCWLHTMCTEPSGPMAMAGPWAGSVSMTVPSTWWSASLTRA